MSYYYTMASLPMLRFREAAPLSIDDFRNACSLLTEQDRSELELILQGRWEEGLSGFSRRWCQLDRQMRSAIARARAGHLGVDASPFTRDFEGYDVSIEQEIQTAYTQKSPLDREAGIDACRWRLLEELAQGDAFCLTALLAYAVQLGIAIRWAQLDDQGGLDEVQRRVDGALDRMATAEDMAND